jgi:hypothetical protein
LTAGHSVVEVVYTYDGHIDITAGGMDKMVAAYGRNVSVTGKNHRRQFRISQF